VLMLSIDFHLFLVTSSEDKFGDERVHDGIGQSWDIRFKI